MDNKELPAAVLQFDQTPNCALVTLATACRIASRSRASFYRDASAGRIQFIKIGNSTRIRVGDLRKLIGADGLRRK